MDSLPMGEKPTLAMRGERLRSSHASLDNLTSKPIPSPLMNDSKWNGKTWVRPLLNVSNYNYVSIYLNTLYQDSLAIIL